MSKEGLKITVEEWANDNNVSVKEEQMKELINAIDICCEMDLYSTGYTLGNSVKSKKDKEIDNLKAKLQTLELFISSKGYAISYDIGRVTEHTMERITDIHVASSSKTTYLEVQP